MNRRQLLGYLQDLPEDTEVMVRIGSEAGLAHVVILDDGTKLTAYMTTFYQELERQEVAPEVLEQMKSALTQPYPEGLREVCPHGRSIMGTCGACDLREEDDEGNDECG